ncbi:hypothetical protein ElyMa_001601000 [Elysia marginata]|uniref:Uncharacterized protein n=1 Tax=Elysia marginata TaxID=1093978 RepID=A0AAV4JG61_9GAST|nr:hypothetical protein ElyMa_001601000 [Elysia marginata]
MSGLCSVLDSLRQSLESDSESENDDLDQDGNSSTNSHVQSWHGSLQQLPTTPSTSESEAGNMSTESHLCRQCGRARRRERARASGCSSLPPGRRLRPRIKKRAHFATDTDNSSDPERLSDSHESSLLFKPIGNELNNTSGQLILCFPKLMFDY